MSNCREWKPRDFSGEHEEWQSHTSKHLLPGCGAYSDPGQPRCDRRTSSRFESKQLGAGAQVYKNSLHDLRRYKRLQMFVHAEALQDDANMLQDGELSIFLRLGSDYRNNYYEYEIPLRITQPGQYSSHTAAGQMAVWPMEIMFDFSLDLFTKLKISRNTDQSSEKVSTSLNHSRKTIRSRITGYDSGKSFVGRGEGADRYTE